MYYAPAQALPAVMPAQAGIQAFGATVRGNDDYALCPAKKPTPESGPPPPAQDGTVDSSALQGFYLSASAALFH